MIILPLLSVPFVVSKYMELFSGIPSNTVTLCSVIEDDTSSPSQNGDLMAVIKYSTP